MSYIGRPIGTPGHTTQKLDAPTDLSSNAFTMKVGGVAISPDTPSLAVYVDGVRQEAGSAYTVAGSTLTFTGTVTGSNHLHAYVMGDAMYVEPNFIDEAKLKISNSPTNGQYLQAQSGNTGGLTWVDPLASPTFTGTITIGSAEISETELEILDGATLSTAELNLLDGVTSTTAELNILDGVTSTAAELNLLDGVSGLVQADLTKLAAVDASATELNYIDGVTSAIQTQMNTKAPLASPTLTGAPLAPTASAATNTTQLATTAFVRTEVSNLVASAPSALDTLNELAAALGDDASFSTTVTNSIALKSPIANPTFTGTITGTLATAAQTAITSVGTLTALTVDDITLNGSTITDGGDLDFDVGGNITLDADDAGEVRIKDGGTAYLFLKKDGNSGLIQSQISDGDLVFGGNDGGSLITAMTIDMSAGGYVGIGSTSPETKLVVKRQNEAGKFTAVLRGGTNALDVSNDWFGIGLGYGGHDSLYINAGILGLFTAANGATDLLFCTRSGGSTNVTDSDARMTITSTGNVSIGGGVSNNKLCINGNITHQGSLLSVRDGNYTIDVDQAGGYSSEYFRVTFNGSAQERFRITQAGNVGIGITAPHSTTRLDVNGAIRAGCGNADSGSTQCGQLMGLSGSFNADNVARVIKPGLTSEGSLWVVSGARNGVSDRFTDLVLCYYGGVVVIQTTNTGTLPTRTYTNSGEKLRVQMNDSSNQYNFKVTGIGGNELSGTSNHGMGDT